MDGEGEGNLAQRDEDNTPSRHTGFFHLIYFSHGALCSEGDAIMHAVTFSMAVCHVKTMQQDELLELLHA